MKTIRRVLAGAVVLLGVAVLFIGWERPVMAYVEAPHSLGQVCFLSTNIIVVRVEQVDREKNTIIYRKVRDLKGTHPTDIIRHNIGRGGFNEREWKYSMQLAEVGKLGDHDRGTRAPHAAALDGQQVSVRRGAGVAPEPAVVVEHAGL